MQLAVHEHLHALVEDLRKALRPVADEHAVDEVGIVLPLAGLRVLPAVVDRDAEAKDARAGCCGPELGVPRQIA